eukprot:m.369126 g.369126  ORF g.369126 m.369126 type:complete len:333 (+) comp19984_c0_seq11:4234-5232(+)
MVSKLRAATREQETTRASAKELLVAAVQPVPETTVAVIMPEAAARDGVLRAILSAASEAGLQVLIDRPVVFTQEIGSLLFPSLPDHAQLAATAGQPCHVALLDGLDAIREWSAMARDLQSGLPQNSSEDTVLASVYASSDSAVALRDIAFFFDPEPMPPLLMAHGACSVLEPPEAHRDMKCMSLVSTQVFRRWSHDGWMYLATVVGYLGGGVLLIEESDGARDTVVSDDEKGDVVLLCEPDCTTHVVHTRRTAKCSQFSYAAYTMVTKCCALTRDMRTALRPVWSTPRLDDLPYCFMIERRVRSMLAAAATASMQAFMTTWYATSNGERQSG